MSDSGELPAVRHPVLLVGPAGSGKTEWCLQRILEVQGDNPMAQVWAVVAGKAQQASISRRLAGRRRAGFGVYPMMFYELFRRIVDLVGTPPRLLKSSSRPYLLREAVQNVASGPRLEHFAPIAHTTGFISAVLDVIDEFQANGVQAEVVERALAGSAKGRDVGRMYRAYSTLLTEKEVVDAHSLGRLALQRLETYPSAGRRIDLLLVDGFDRLTLEEILVLRLLAARAARTIITLTYAPGREDGAHRTFGRTYRSLVDHLDPEVVELDYSKVAAARPAALDHLERNLFVLAAGRDGADGKLPTGGAVSLLEAPNPLREVREVGRRVKRLLIEGARPDEVAVVARSLEVYGPLCREVFQAYGIPASVASGTPLVDNPAIGAIVKLISLADADFPRRQVIETLRSPYLGRSPLTPAQVDTLDDLSREKAVVLGREAWLAALSSRAAASALVDDDEGSDPGRTSPEDVRDTHHRLAAFFDRVTPPPEGQAVDHVRWVELLIGRDPEEAKWRQAEEDGAAAAEDSSFGVIEAVRSGPSEVLERDIVALDKLTDVLRDTLAGFELVTDGAVITWDRFRDEFLGAVAGERYEPVARAAGCVTVAEARARRGVPVDHLFLLGMSEGNFPHRQARYSFLDADDRAALSGAGAPLAANEDADEASLFYEVTSLARGTLTLSRPYLDDTGNPWPQSPYFREVRRLLDAEPERYRLRYLPPPEDAACLDELLLSGGLMDGPVAGWVSRQAGDRVIREAVRRSLAAELARWGEEDRSQPYSGRVADDSLLASVRSWLGGRHSWSASQFNEYAWCPFWFFARRLLKLQGIEEPVEGMDALQLGILNHQILELTYRRLMEDSIAVIPDNVESIHGIFNEVSARQLDLAPEALGFQPTPWWKYEAGAVRDQLWRLIAKDVMEGAAAEPIMLEAAFGHGWPDGPLEIDGAAGTVTVGGRIDRVDRVAGGYRVIDYKSGSTPISGTDQKKGRQLQMQVYLLAAETLLRKQGYPDGPIQGVFWHIPNSGASGKLELADDAVQQAAGTIHEKIVLRSRQGLFGVPRAILAAGKCRENGKRCEFGALCRATERL